MNNNSKIGERIKSIRLEKGLTLQELGAKVGLSHASLSKYESGNVPNIPINRISDIAKALDVDPGYLMGWNEDESPQKKLVNELIELTSQSKINWESELSIFTDSSQLSKYFYDLSYKYKPELTPDYKPFYFFHNEKDILYIVAKFKTSPNEFIYTLSVAKTRGVEFGGKEIVNIVFLVDSEMVDNIEYLYLIASGESSNDLFIDKLINDLQDMKDIDINIDDIPF